MSADARARSTRRREPAARPARGGSAHGLGLKVFGLFQASYKIHVCVYIYVVFIYVFIYVYLFIFMFVFLFSYLFLFRYICMCMCVCNYSLYMHIFMLG